MPDDGPQRRTEFLTPMKNLINQFNQPGTLLVVSSYPDPKTGIKGIDAVAWHSHQTLHGLAKNQKIIVFSSPTPHSTTPHLDGPQILVLPVWRKGHPTSLLNLLFSLLRFSRAKTVLFQFEFNVFGGLISTLLIPLITLVLRLSGKSVLFEIHQVITDISSLGTHLNLTHPVLQKFFGFGLISFYHAIGLLANHVVVLEEELRSRLINFVPANKVTTIPISTTTRTKINQTKAKKLLGFQPSDFVVMSFGFINWYKGSDWIVKAFSHIKSSHLKLLLTGGPSPTLQGKRYYQNYYQKLTSQISKSANIRLTGFIPEDQFSLYFSAADLVILPYRVFMSSSGPLSFAYSFRKPFIISSALKAYLSSPDFAANLAQSKLKPADVFFTLDHSRFGQKLQSTQKVLPKLIRFATLMSRSRSQKTISLKYQSLINSLDQNSHLPTPNPVYYSQ